MSSFLEYLTQDWDNILELSIAHAQVVIVSVLITTVIGVAAGVLSYRSPTASTVVLNVTNTFLTIPSFALFGLLIPVVGLGYPPAVFALVLYGMLPVVRNTIAGLRNVDPAITESAAGMGMNARQRLIRIEAPLAWPVILAGVRVSTLIIMGIAAIAAVIGSPGLGEYIFTGISRIGSPVALNLLLSGTLGVIVLALIFDGALALLGRITIPGGMKN